ncbi:MAG: transcription termination/antitermination NusG family protein [Luminiphilus sp.]|nr:transcription termination/antitermination NusG family protein [Luminiphilus sp.]
MNTDPAKTEPAMQSVQAAWYVVATKPRNESVAKLALERQGYRLFLPTINLKKRRRGQWNLVTEPLFPGYLFVALALGTDDPAPIRSTKGCVGLVRFGHTYTSVPVELIAAFEGAAVTEDSALSPFQSGDAVRLMSGPFAGLEAIYDKARGEERAQVLLKILGRFQRLTVAMDTLDK